MLMAGGRREKSGAGGCLGRGCPSGGKENLPGLMEALTPDLNA